jgi:hypothetical protein
VPACLQVVAAANQQLQQLVQELATASKDGTADMSVLTALRTSISQLAAVQQEDIIISASIKAMADKVASDPSYNVTADLATFTQVCVDRQRTCKSHEGTLSSTTSVCAAATHCCHQRSAPLLQTIILCVTLGSSNTKATDCSKVQCPSIITSPVPSCCWLKNQHPMYAYQYSNSAYAGTDSALNTRTVPHCAVPYCRPTLDRGCHSGLQTRM